MHRYLTPEIDGEGRNSLVAQLPPSKASISDKPPISSAQYVLALALDLVAKEAQFNRFFGALAGSFGSHRSVCSANRTFKGISSNDVQMLWAYPSACFSLIVEEVGAAIKLTCVCPLCQTVYGRSEPVRP